MANLSGQFRGTGIATTAARAQTAYRLVVPENTSANLAIIAIEAVRWTDTVRLFDAEASASRIAWDIPRRARFAADVLQWIVTIVGYGGSCILAQSPDGRILGVSNYGFWDPASGGIYLQAIDPEHFPGAPGVAQLRGIGTALTAAISRDMLAHGVEVLYLHPLDSAAAVFWSSRGFQPCGGGGRMCISGRVEIQKLIDGCFAIPDCGPGGECLLCGTARAAEVPVYPPPVAVVGITPPTC